MSEGIKVAVIALTPFFVLGALLYFTRRNQKRRFFILMSVLIIGNLWIGFLGDWRTQDFLGLGLALLVCIVGCFAFLREKHKRDEHHAA